MTLNNTEVKLFIIAGGPGGGKITLPYFLEGKGFSVITQSAGIIIIKLF